MKFFLCTSDSEDSRYCLVTSHGSPLSDPLAEGEEVQPVLDELGEDVVRLDLDERDGGLERPDLVGNDQNYLLLRRDCADAILAGFNLGPHELVPVTLINKKKRVHAEDYVVLNPLGQIDCLDKALSDMDGDPDNPTVRIFGKFYLRRSAIPEGRDIFRVAGVIGYLFSERLVDFIRQREFTNFVLAPVQLS